MKPISYWTVVLAICIFANGLFSQITFQDVTSTSGIAGSHNTAALSFNDYDHDGNLDLFVTHNSGTQLYHNNGNGAFSDTDNVASLGNAFAISAQMGDYDNDGDLDIAIAGEAGSSNLKIFRNDGSSIFTDVTSSCEIGSVTLRIFSLAWLDFDQDGYLDLFCAAIGNQKNRLYKNLGNGIFSDYSVNAGISVAANARGVATGDFDGDGDIDIFIPNSDMANNLYRNDNHVYTDVAGTSGINPSAGNHGSQFADYDNDGDLDLLIGVSGGPYQLLKNIGGTFADVTVSSGLYLNGGLCLGASFSDFDNDGDLDLVAQVHVPGKKIALFSNDGDGTFTDVSGTSNIQITTSHTSNTLATGDYDNDGKVDVYIGEAAVGATGTLPDYLFRNTTTAVNHWVELKLVGVISNNSAIGAWIEISAGGSKQYRQITAGNGFNNQHSLIQHFGLGNATTIDTIFILWPSGIRQKITNINCNQVVTITESEPVSQFTKITTGSIVNDGSRSFGVAWGDYDNDGNVDLFVSNVNGENNILYHNRGDGTFDKVITGSIVNDGGSSLGCSWGDFNNDGFIDLYVTNYPNSEDNFLYKNNGDGTFTKIINGPHIQDNGSSYTSSWIDYNNDGLLDLYVTNDWGENNSLYRNNGDGTFFKITNGSIVTDGGNSLGCAWSDYDNDGDQDLFVANWNSQNNFLYKNNGNGTFIKITSGNMVTDGKSSTGGSWGDYNNDGYMDLFVANDNYENNLLYKNNGDGTFTQITSGDIVNDGGKSVGSSWGDFNNDGFLDMYVVNIGAKNFLYQNNGNGTFTKITTGSIVHDVGQSRGCTWIDYDNDGFVDMFVTNDLHEDNNLYRNNGNVNHWLKIKCVGDVSNKSAIGAKIRIKTTMNNSPLWQVREISGQSGYCSQNELTAHFGLGSATMIDTLLIEWPSGLRQVMTNIQSDQFLTVEENSTDVHLSLDTVYALPNQSGFMNITMNNITRVSAMEFSLNGDFSHIQLDSFSLMNRAQDMEFIFNPANNKIVVYSSSQSFIETGSGPVARIRFSFIDGTLMTDTLLIGFINPLIAGVQNEPLTCTTQGGMIISFRKGDVNADGYINVLDVQETARIIVGLPVTSYPDYETKLFLADANPFPVGDGLVNIFDLNAIIQMSLSQGFGDTSVITKTSHSQNDSMNIILSSETAISALQFDVSGAVISSFRLNNLSHKIKTISNGKRVMIYSADGQIEPGQKVLGTLFYSSENGSLPVIQNPIAGTQEGEKLFAASSGNHIISKTTVINQDDLIRPVSFDLYQNYPNPFNPTTHLSYKLFNDADVSLIIYNMLGQEIKTVAKHFQTAGLYEYQWNGLNNSGQSVGSGIYIYTLKTGKTVKSRKMIYLK